MRLSRSAESATDAISLVLHSVSHALKSLKAFRGVETHRRSRGKVPTISEEMKRGDLSVVKK